MCVCVCVCVWLLLRVFASHSCLPSFPAEQMDGGLAGRQRQYEGWIHNLSKELNLYKTANLELSSRLRELCGPVCSPGDPGRGNTLPHNTGSE